MNEDDHLFVARLEEGVLNVRVEDVHLVAADGGEAEAVRVRLERAAHALRAHVRADEHVLEPRVRTPSAEHERLLLYDALELALLLLVILEPVLHVLHEAESRQQVRRRRHQLARLLLIRRAERAVVASHVV